MFSCEEGARDYVVPQTYHADWFVRGQTSAHQSKKPWKLSFKDKNGDKKNISVGEMGEDDDWILNPMNMEDTKIREKLAMDIWNQDIADSSGGYRMSTADYVEVVMNEEYQGLYLMQRRIDEKYLKLNKEDILLKARTTYTWTLLEEAYEIVYSPFDSEKTYEILQDVLVKNSFDVDSLMNTSLFLEFFCMVDNAADKNMCYVLKSTSQGYKMYWVPWDTDISLGLWYNDGFVYDYETTMHSAVRREEYYSVQEKEEQIDEWYMGLWNELRDTVYTSEKIIHRIISLQERIENSGAFQRDQSLNGTKYGGRDTHQELIRWCEERVETFYQ